MGLEDSSFPSSVAFNSLSAAFSDETARNNAIKAAGNTVFAVELTNPSGSSARWILDLKDTGTISKDTTNKTKADVTLVLKDEDFSRLLSGKANAQSLFMTGKLKIRGDVMKATRLEPILAKASDRAKL